MAGVSAKLAEKDLRLGKQLSDNALALALLIVLNFLLPRWLPGDPVDALLGEGVIAGYSDTQLALLKAQMGLDGSGWQQFGIYLAELARGNLGYSAFHAAPVAEVLGEALPWTLLLLAGSIPLSLVLGAGPGLIAGARRGSLFDHWSGAVAALLSSIPSFAVAMLLLGLFSVHLGWFPISGAASLFGPPPGWLHGLDLLWHALLPMLALALHGGVRYFYLSRGVALALSQRPFLFAARARGVRGRRLLIHYYGRNALPALLAKLSGTVPMVMGATLFVEVIFSYPGVGHLMLDAIQARDYPLVQGGLFLLSLMVLTINSMLDLLIAILGRRG